MELKEFKEKVKSKSVDIIAHLGVLTLSEIMDIEDVSEAKKNFDELSDLINEYIEEYEKPKFKVGDYVVYEGFETHIAKIDSITSNEFHGIWYTQETEYFKQDYFYGTEYIRYTTQEEIAEYKAALQFHKHGRKPFEVKYGDLAQGSDLCKHIVTRPESWCKQYFTSGDFAFLKTAEELEAWLSDGKADIE